MKVKIYFPVGGIAVLLMLVLSPASLQDTHLNPNLPPGITLNDANADPIDCDCGVWGDVTGEGLVNALDFAYIINYLFKGQDHRVQPPNCPLTAGDIDCDGFPTALDLGLYFNQIFLNWDSFCANPCG